MKTRYHLLLSLVCLIAFISVLLPALIGCNSSSSYSGATSDEQTAINPAGIWLGTQSVIEKNAAGEVVADLFDMKTIIYDGQFFGISEEANILFSGTYEMGENGRMIVDGRDDGNHRYRTYTVSEGGTSWVNGIAALQFHDNGTFSGRFQNDAYQEGELQSRYSTLYEKGAALESLTGEYTSETMNLTIDASGQILGTKSGCELSGQISLPDENVNIYRLDYTLTAPASGGCAEKGGQYSGLGIVALDQEGSPYFLGLSHNSDASRMDGLYLSLHATPLSFTVASIDKAVSRFLGFNSGESVLQKILFLANLENWPFLVSDAVACLIIGPSLSQEGIRNRLDGRGDGSEQRITGMRDFRRWASSSGTYGEGHYRYYDLGDFEKADFTNMYFSHLADGFIYTRVARMIFDGADMSNVEFDDAMPMEMCHFVNTNLEGSNISEANYNSCPDPLEEFLLGNQSGNDFSGAWWEDGHRCGIDLGLMPEGACTANWIDTGLSYEEWKNGKGEVEKIAENVVEKVEDLADDGLSFAKDTGSSVVESISSWF